MKKYLIYLMMAAVILTFGACSADDNEPEMPEIEAPDTPDGGGEETPETPDTPEEPETPGGGSKLLVAYFSWGGTTERMAQEIAGQTGADLFRIESVVPYPTNYTECTQVALVERDTDARPAIAAEMENWEEYDVIFIGCPVWWHTAPMIINTFSESYDFAGKTVIPFCTYASTYRDETLARIVELTPAAEHLAGEGLTGSRINAENVGAWLREIGMME